MKPGRKSCVLAACFTGLLFLSTGMCEERKPCPVSDNSVDCCECLCSESCMPGFYHSSSSTSPDECDAQASTTASTPTTSTSTTSSVPHTTITAIATESSSVIPNLGENGPTNSTPEVTTTAVTPRNIMCIKCHKDCKNCNGSGPSNCTECKDGYIKDSTGLCVPIPIIVGASVGGGVVLIVVVVVVAVCCIRRRKRQRQPSQPEDEAELDDGMMQSPSSPRLTEVKEDETPQSQASVKSTGGIYENIPKMPRPDSIAIGHDKVLRYTRDPTIKVNRPEPQSSNTEDEELQGLPPAPGPPSDARKKSAQAPPREEYEITEPSGLGSFQPTSNSNSSSSSKPQRPVTILPKGGRKRQGKEPRRKTEPGSMPIPIGGVSLPNLPSQTNPKIAVRQTSNEDPEEDYENAPRPKPMRKPPPIPEESRKDGDDEDLDDYENTGSKGSLMPRDRKDKRQVQGKVNLGADLGDEPEEMYGNQDIIEEQKRDEEALEDYIPMTGAPRRPSDDCKLDSVDDQPIYGNEDERHLYENMDFGPPK